MKINCELSVKCEIAFSTARGERVECFTLLCLPTRNAAAEPALRSASIDSTIAMSNQCNLVINELLCFLQCKIDLMDELTLIQICCSNFGEDEILQAKTILGEATNSRSMRKGDGKNKRLLQDIIKTLKETEPTSLPTFVARDLNRLPPVYFDYVDVSSLLKSILMLKQDVHRIQCDYIKSSELTKVQLELEDIKTNLLSKSSVIELTNDLFLKTTGNHSSPALPVLPAAPPSPATPAPRLAPVQVRDSGRDHSNTEKTFAEAVQHKNFKSNPVHRTKSPKVTDLGQSGILRDTDNDDSFTTVVSKRHKHKPERKNRNQQGKAVLTSNKIKIVPKLSYIYASRFDTHTSEKDICEFITDGGHTAVKVEKLSQFKETSFSSFKITIEQEQESTFLDAEFWPRGVLYRRYKERRVGTVLNKRTVLKSNEN